MTKFEKVAKRAELLQAAYNAILDKYKWDNYENPWTDEPTLDENKTEEHELYQSVLKEIENLL